MPTGLPPAQTHWEGVQGEQGGREGGRESKEGGGEGGREGGGRESKEGGREGGRARREGGREGEQGEQRGREGGGGEGGQKGSTLVPQSLDQNNYYASRGLSCHFTMEWHKHTSKAQLRQYITIYRTYSGVPHI